LSDIAEHHNNAITKSAGNPLTSSLPASLPPASLPPASLPPASLPPAFEPLVSPPAASKKFNHRRASASLKKQADRIAAQNVEHKIAFESYVLAILF
jgi:hypothetical protein